MPPTRRSSSRNPPSHLSRSSSTTSISLRLAQTPSRDGEDAMDLDDQVDASIDDDEDDSMDQDQMESTTPSSSSSSRRGGISETSASSSSAACGPPPPGPPNSSSSSARGKGKGKENVPPQGEDPLLHLPFDHPDNSAGPSRRSSSQPEQRNGAGQAGDDDEQPDTDMESESGRRAQPHQTSSRRGARLEVDVVIPSYAPRVPIAMSREPSSASSSASTSRSGPGATATDDAEEEEEPTETAQERRAKRRCLRSGSTSSSSVLSISSQGSASTSTSSSSTTASPSASPLFGNSSSTRNTSSGGMSLPPLTRSLSLSASATGRANHQHNRQNENSALAQQHSRSRPGAGNSSTSTSARRPSNALGRSSSFASTTGSVSSNGSSSSARGTTSSRRGAKREREREGTAGLGEGRERGMSVSSVRSVSMRSECGSAPLSSSSSTSSAASSPYLSTFPLPSPGPPTASSVHDFPTLSSFPFASSPAHSSNQVPSSPTPNHTALEPGTPPRSTKADEEEDQHRTPRASGRRRGHAKTPSVGTRGGLRSSSSAATTREGIQALSMNFDVDEARHTTPPPSARNSSTEDIATFQSLSLTPRASGHRRTGSRSAAIQAMKPLKLEHDTPALVAASSSPLEEDGEDVAVTPVATPTKIPAVATGLAASNRSRKGKETIRGNSSVLMDSEADDEEEEIVVVAPKTLFAAPATASPVPSVVRAKPTDGYKALKAVLRCSSAGTSAVEDLFASDSEAAPSSRDTIVGREVEKQTVWAYLSGEAAPASEDSMDVDSPSASEEPSRALYISGQPGTGKTALVSSLAGKIVHEKGWKVAFVNCMGLAGKGGDEVWKRMAEGWRIELLPRKKAERVVDEELSRAAGQQGGFLLVLDEVDALMADTASKTANSTSSHLLKTLFSLGHAYPTSNIKVVAISNSLDLTSRRSISSVLGERSPQTFNFQSYGSKEMIEIVKARVAAAALSIDKPAEVDAKAIELVTRKVEASNGDLRMCLSVMVEAVSMAETEWRKKKAAAGPDVEVVKTKVSLSHVVKALASFNKLRAASGSGSIGAAAGPSSSGNGLAGKVKSLSLQVRVILLALLVARKRNALGLRPVHSSASSLYGPASGTSSTSASTHISPEALYPTYSHLLSHGSSPFAPASQTDFMDLMMQAEVIGVLAIESAGSSPVKLGAGAKGKPRGSKGKERSIELMMREEDLKAALGLSTASGGEAAAATDSEVRAMWFREESKWLKAAENRQRNVEEAKRKAERGPVGFDME